MGQFSNCTAQRSINVASGNSYFKIIDGVLFAHDYPQPFMRVMALYKFPEGRSDEVYVMPDECGEFGAFNLREKTNFVSAFRNCKNLKTIVISDGVIKIPEEAFYGCTSLTSVVIPASVDWIGSDIFSGCTNIKDIYFAGSKTDWNNITNYSADSFNNVTIHYNYSARPAVTAKGGDKRVTLTWTKVNGATKYGVYIYANNKYTKLSTEVTGTTYTATGLDEDTEYTFFVQAYKNNKWCAGSDTSYATARTNEGITYPVVTAKGGDKQITLSWTEVNGATKYGVYIYANSKYTKLSTEVTGTTYTVTGLAEDTEYTFFVQAYKNNKWCAGSDVSYATARTNEGITYPVVTAKGGDKSVTLTWTKVNGATKYGVYIYANSKYTKLSTEVTGTTDTQYTFFVQAYKDGKWQTGADKSYATATTNPGLTYPVVTAKGGDKSVTLTWTKVSGATKYGVYRFSGSTYTKIDLAVTGTSYTVTGLDDDTEYTFFVQAYKEKWLAGGSESYAIAKTNAGTGNSGTSSSGTEPVTVVYPELTAVGGDKSVRLSWTAVPSAAKYGIYRSVNGNLTAISTSVSGTSYTVTGLADDTEYTFCVKAYVNGGWQDADSKSYATAKTNAGALYPVLTAVGGNKSVNLSRTTVSGATKYAVYKIVPMKSPVLLTETTGTSYTATGLDSSTSYTFYLQMYKDGAWQSCGSESSATVTAN